MKLVRCLAQPLMILFVTLIVALSGCTSTGLSPLTELENRQVRLIALNCYSNNDGLRMAYGGAGVWEACLTAAHKKVRGPIGKGVRLNYGVTP